MRETAVYAERGIHGTNWLTGFSRIDGDRAPRYFFFWGMSEQHDLSPDRGLVSGYKVGSEHVICL